MSDNWIIVKSRPMNEDELKCYALRLGGDPEDIEGEDAIIFTSQFPDSGQEVLVCNKWGHIWIDTFCDDDDGVYLEENGDMDGIIAWMPLPNPPKECENNG